MPKEQNKVDENITIVQKWFIAANKNDPGALEDVFAEDYVGHRANGSDEDLQRMAGIVAFLNEKSIVVEVIKIFGEGDRVGALLRLARNEQAFEEIQIYRISNGKIAERWIVVDRNALQKLLG